MYPVLFEIGNFPIAPYGILIALGLLAGIWFALPRTRHFGIADERLIDLVVYGIVAGIAGAKLLYIITHFNEFQLDPWGTILARDGLVFYGGFLALLPVSYWYIRKHRLPMWNMLDAIGPSIPLAHAFGRLGCFFAGCCYGEVCDAQHPLHGIAVRFPWRDEMPPPPAFGDHAAHGRLSDDAQHAFLQYLESGTYPQETLWSLPVVPTQLIEMTCLIALTVVLWLVWRRRSFAGQVIAVYFFSYGIIRFLIEYLRGDADRGLYFGGLLSISQLISLGMVAVGVWIWFDFFNLKERMSPLPAADSASNPNAESKTAKKSAKNKK